MSSFKVSTRVEYGSRRSPFWGKYSVCGNTVEAVYLGKVERITRDGKVTWKRYLDEELIYGAETSTNNQQLTGTQWNKTVIHKDHLGSVDVLTNSNGQIIEPMSFHP